MNQTTMKKRGRKEPFMMSSKYHCSQMHLFLQWLLTASNGNRMALLQLFFTYSLANTYNKLISLFFPEHNRPRLSSEHGNLVFHAGSSKNIEFRTGSLGKIKINEEDLAELFSQVI